MTKEENTLSDCIDRMRPYSEVRYDTTKIRQWIEEIELDLYTLQWIAAGGLGASNRESIVEDIDAQIANLQTLRQQVEELDDPREVRKQIND